MTADAKDVDALARLIAQQRPASLPLDFSYPSLDRVEDFYLARLETHTDPDAALDARIAAYVGATLAHATGGVQQPPRSKADMNRDCVTSLPALGKARFYPLDVVLTFKRLRWAGYMRDATELWDVPLRRAYMQTFIASLPQTLAAAPPSVDALEEQLKANVASHAARDIIRRTETMATAYLGQIVQREVGGEWTLCEDPKDGDFGQLEMHGWAPISAIRNVGPDSRPHLLQGVLDLVIKGRRSK